MKQAKTIFEMFKRLAPTGEKEANNLHKKLNQDDIAKKLMEVVKKTTKGGNPLSPDLFG
jgi:hypothetical protein